MFIDSINKLMGIVLLAAIIMTGILAASVTDISASTTITFKIGKQPKLKYTPAEYAAANVLPVTALGRYK